MPREKKDPDAQYTLNEEARKVGERLIDAHHRHLADAEILYLFVDKELKVKGQVVLGKAQKLGPLDRFLSVGGDVEGTRIDFVLLFPKPQWYLLNSTQREAVVDHELCHCGYDMEADQFVLRGHDLEEFAEIVSRHGLYKRDVKEFTEIAAQQLPLLEPAR